MVKEEKVKLESGKEILINPIKFFQRAEIIDLSLKYYKDNVPVSLTVCGKAILYATDIRERELDDWNTIDIYELGSKIFERLHLTKEQKKS